MSRFRKFLVLTCLYLAQGLPYGFFTQALPALLREAGRSLPEIGFASLLTLPWALKFLWAPAVDRWGIRGVGLRRSWLLPLQFASVGAFAFLAILSPAGQLGLILGAFLLTNLLSASQDIAADGLALDLLGSADRGWANGIQVGAYRVGMLIGGAALLWLYDRTGWSPVMLAMAAIVAVTTLPVVFLREPARVAERPPAKTSKEILHEIVHFAGRPGALAWILVLLLFKDAHYLATAMLRPWLVDQGYSLVDLATLLGTYGFGAGLAGAAVGGWAASRFERRRLLLVFGAIELIATASYLGPVAFGWGRAAVGVVIAADHFTSGLATVTLFALMMDACSRERAAADYTFQSCLVVAATAGASALSGVSAGALGYANHFRVVGLFALFALGLSAWLVRRPATRDLLAAGAET